METERIREGKKLTGSGDIPNREVCLATPPYDHAHVDESQHKSVDSVAEPQGHFVAIVRLLNNIKTSPAVGLEGLEHKQNQSAQGWTCFAGIVLLLSKIIPTVLSPIERICYPSTSHRS
jgi:hypothetical protein